MTFSLPHLSAAVAAFVALLAPSPIGTVRTLLFRRSLRVTLTEAIKPVESGVLSYTRSELIANKPAVIEELKKLETPAIQHIADFVVANLPKGGLLTVVAGPLGAAVKSYETQIIGALGGNDEALFALVLHEVDVLEHEIGLV